MLINTQRLFCTNLELFLIAHLLFKPFDLVFLRVDWCFMLSGLWLDSLFSFLFFSPPHFYCWVLPSAARRYLVVLWGVSLDVAPHSLSLVELVREVRNAKATTRFRVRISSGHGEARTGYIVERGTDMTRLPTEKERAKKWWQKKLFNLNSRLSSEVNCILPLHVWMLMSLVLFFF